MTTRRLAGVMAGRMRPLMSRLPQHPPALALAIALNRLLLHRLPDDTRLLLSNRAVLVEVTDVGLQLRLQLGQSGFEVASRSAPVALRFAAEAGTYWRLLSGTDDADRLFFERLLVMEGDTEMGLILKNTLDAVGPLWR